jgi:hypothetical protein
MKWYEKRLTWINLIKHNVQEMKPITKTHLLNV